MVYVCLSCRHSSLLPLTFDRLRAQIVLRTMKIKTVLCRKETLNVCDGKSKLLKSSGFVFHECHTLLQVLLSIWFDFLFWKMQKCELFLPPGVTWICMKACFCHRIKKKVNASIYLRVSHNSTRVKLTILRR